MTAKAMALVDVRGNPLSAHSAHSGGYEGGRQTRELSSWLPALRSADAEILPDHTLLTARTHDAVRNNGMISGGIQLQLDSIIGSDLQLSAKPDHVALGITDKQAAEWSKEIESRWWNYANSLEAEVDAGHRWPFSVLLGMATRSLLVAGEITSTAEWIRDPARRYHTAIQMIDPARVSNPGGMPDTDRLRAGIELDDYAGPAAAHIRQALESDAYLGANTYQWRRVPWTTPWGRRQFLHAFEPERPGQTRGVSGIAAALAKSKMLERFQGANLEAAIVNAMYAAIIESEFDYAKVAEALGANESATSLSDSVATALGEFHSAGTVRFDGVKIPHLYPGEKFRMIAQERPGPGIAEFESSFLGYLAAALGTSREQLTRDYSKTNFAGARAGMQDTWRFFRTRRHRVTSLWGTQVYALWLEEEMDRGGVYVPPGAPSFWEAKTAWCGCRWIGGGPTAINPMQDASATLLEMEFGLTTLEDACAERGKDWEENLVQIAREKARMKELNLTTADLAQVLGATARQPAPSEAG